MLVLSLALQGCIAPWQAQLDKAKTDVQHLQTEDQEQANYQTCVDQGAMPGSAENLACRLELAKKSPDPAKAQKP